MEVEREIEREIDEVEDQLRSNSLEDVLSCSSSILDTPQGEGNGDEYDDDDDFEDGINVTLVSSPGNVLSKKKDDTKGVSPQNAPIEKKPIMKMNGAAKKRFKYLLTQGHAPEEARVLAKKPFRTPCIDPAKRRRNVDPNGSNSSGGNPPKRIALQVATGHPPTSSVQERLNRARYYSEQPSTSTGNYGHKAPTHNEYRNKPSFRDALNSVKVGILTQDYPSTELTNQQMIATQKAILKHVSQQRKQKIKPKFGNCLFRPGYMIIVCKNQDTANWLKAAIPSINPWENACLIAVDENRIPQPEILVGFFPRSAEDSTEDILALLESQNEGLVVDAWRILKRYIVKQYHTELIFTVDAVSMKTLEDCKFDVDYKFGNAFIRKKVPTRTENTGEDQSQNPNICENTTVDTDNSSTATNKEASDVKDQNIIQTSDASVDVEMGCCHSDTSTCKTNERHGKGLESDHEAFAPGNTHNASNNNGQKSSEYRKIQVHAKKYKSMGDCSTRAKEQ